MKGFNQKGQKVGTKINVNISHGKKTGLDRMTNRERDLSRKTTTRGGGRKKT